MPDFTTLIVELQQGVAMIRLNRPDKANSMDEAMWRELGEAFRWADATPEARVVVLSGNGRHFCSGIDLAMLVGVQQAIKDDCQGRAAEKLRGMILQLQDCLSSLERCRKPVLAAIHGACVGAGLDMVAAADLRYCTASAHFSIKEIDLGMVADVGTLQRLPKLVAPGLVREWAFTGRKIKAPEAVACGLVNQVFESDELMEAGVLELARQIAGKSPLSIRGTKEMLNYTRDHSVADGLVYIATWNAAMLVSQDIQTAMMAAMSKQAPVFRD
ncbi:MAG: crotonase/enoyl-CoA hydratase family protein [Acidobacteriota bacterium]|nr:crotonase/enoyl-CoA hydratase family protein [Acidobacteriota bacterium]